jgi:tetratricopeptide (TPR) repeat protein
VKLTMLAVCVLALAGALTPVHAQGAVVRPPLAVAETLSAATLPALCDQIIARYERDLPQSNRAVVGQTVFDLDALAGMGPLLDDAVDRTISGLTLCLTTAQTPNTVVVLAAQVARRVPANARAANLLGSALHTVAELPAATAVMQHALTLEPDSVLLMLNLANIYLDANRDEDTKALLDKVLEADDTNENAWQTMACYWYRKQDYRQTWEALLRAARFGGVVRKTQERQGDDIKQNPIVPGEPIEAAEAKLARLKGVHPATMADVIEGQYPAEAARIRNYYGQLTDSEKLRLPELPQVNLNSAKAYQENSAVLDEWRNALQERVETFVERAAKEGAAAADQQAAADAAAAGADAGADAAAAGGDEGADAGADADADAAGDQGDGQGEGDDGPKIVVDTGGPFTAVNYALFLYVKNSHEFALGTDVADYRRKAEAIREVYKQKVEAERQRYSEAMDKLNREHDQEPGHGDEDIPCRREHLRHRKNMNVLANDYYPQWSELIFPRYTQHHRHLLEDVWNTSALWVKCIHDPESMKAAYKLLASDVSGLTELVLDELRRGGTFEYQGETDEEEDALQAAQEAAEKEAQEKAEAFRQAVVLPETGLADWLKEHLVIDVSAGVLGLKVTAHSIEFKAWLAGVSGTAKYELEGDYIETSTGVGPRLDIGAEVAGVGLKLTARGDVARKTARFGLSDGSYSESYDADGEVKGTAGVLQGKVDVSLDTELHARARGEVSVGNVLRARSTGSLE